MRTDDARNRDGRDPPARYSRCVNCENPRPYPSIGLCPECKRWRAAYWRAIAYIGSLLDNHSRLPERAP
jgi:hypothetical protein